MNSAAIESITVAEPPLSAWPAEERPRERLAQLGARQLTDAELIALILRSGLRGQSAMSMARRLQALAEERGGWSQLSLADLKALRGMGLARAASVLAGLEWGRREAGKAPASVALNGPGAVAAALRPLLAGRPVEHVAVLALDARRRVLASELVSQGTLTTALAHPRDIFRSAIKLGAAAVVVGHNHPSGDPAPSPEDHALTRRLREAAEILALPLVDHVIVGEPGYFSYAEHGWPR